MYINQMVFNGKTLIGALPPEKCIFGKCCLWLMWLVF